MSKSFSAKSSERKSTASAFAFGKGAIFSHNFSIATSLKSIPKYCLEFSAKCSVKLFPEKHPKSSTFLLDKSPNHTL